MINMKLIFLVLLLCFGLNNTSTADELDIRELPCFWFDESSNNETSKYLQRERDFANYSWVYSILSANSYVTPSDPLKIPLPKSSNWEEFGVVEEEDLDLGFYSRAWLRTKKDENQLIISFKGTDTDGGAWNDFIYGNLAFVPYIFGRTQFDSAIDFTNNVIKEVEDKGKKYEKIIFTGHSLGGGLAQYAQRFYSNSKAVVFDPSPNRGRIYSLFNDKYDLNAVRVFEKGEILDYLRKGIDPDLQWDWKPDAIGKSTIWLDFYADGPIDGHSIDDLSTSLVRVAASTGNEGALSVIKQIESKVGKNDIKCEDNIYRKNLWKE